MKAKLATKPSAAYNDYGRKNEGGTMRILMAFAGMMALALTGSAATAQRRPFPPEHVAALSIPEPDAKFIRNLSHGTQGPGALVAELLVAPDHTVEGCRVLSQASEAVTKRICDRARKEKVSIVAMDMNGLPIHGFVTVARVLASSTHSYQPGMWTPADVQVEVIDIPGRATQEVLFVTVLVNKSGVIEHCQKVTGQNQELASVACAQASQYRQPIVQDRTGAAVPYVKLLQVEFVERPAQPRE